MGRKRREIDVGRAEELARAGLSNEQIRHALGMSSGTFYARKKENEEFEEALSRARARAEGDVADVLWSLMHDETAPHIVRLKAAVFWLERRGQSWTLNQIERRLEAENAGSQIPSIEVQVVDYRLGDKPMTMEESARKIEELKAKGVLDDEGRPRPEAFNRDQEREVDA